MLHSCLRIWPSISCSHCLDSLSRWTVTWCCFSSNIFVRVFHHSNRRPIKTNVYFHAMSTSISTSVILGSIGISGHILLCCRDIPVDCKLSYIYSLSASSQKHLTPFDDKEKLSPDISRLWLERRQNHPWYLLFSTDFLWILLSEHSSTPLFHSFSLKEWFSSSFFFQWLYVWSPSISNVAGSFYVGHEDKSTMRLKRMSASIIKTWCDLGWHF